MCSLRLWKNTPVLDLHNLRWFPLSFPNVFIGNPASGKKREGYWIPDKLVLMEMGDGEAFGNVTNEGWE
ncbi:MAG: hypothetical protein QY317_03055 [Candidatus Jettenia caeni]|nr:MAG: hypothetical protein QY317_03055 [Candidatus Jettenia caeni]